MTVIFFKVSDIEEPPPDFDGRVDAEEFWEKVAMEVISRGLVTSEYINYCFFSCDGTMTGLIT